jgi:hypothetical protein
MPVSKEQIIEMRRTLESDRELCGNSPLAQAYLNGCETLQNSLALDVAERLIGTDDVDSAELKAMAADLHNWQEAFDAIPASEHGTTSYKFADACLRILKRNYVALFRKNEVETLPAPENATAN